MKKIFYGYSIKGNLYLVDFSHLLKEILLLVIFFACPITGVVTIDIFLSGMIWYLTTSTSNICVYASIKESIIPK